MNKSIQEMKEALRNNLLNKQTPHDLIIKFTLPNSLKDTLEYIGQILDLDLPTEITTLENIIVTNSSLIITSDSQRDSYVLVSKLKQELKKLKKEVSSLEEKVHFSLPFINSFEQQPTDEREDTNEYFDRKSYLDFSKKLEIAEIATLHTFDNKYLRNALVKYFSEAFVITEPNETNITIKNIVDTCLTNVNTNLKDSLVSYSSDYYFEFARYFEDYEIPLNHSMDFDYHDITNDIINELEPFENLTIQKRGLAQKMIDIDYEEYDEVPDDFHYQTEYRLSDEGSDITFLMSNQVLARRLMYDASTSFTNDITHIITWHYMNYLKVKQNKLFDEILKEQFLSPTMTLEEMSSLALQQSINSDSI